MSENFDPKGKTMNEINEYLWSIAMPHLHKEVERHFEKIGGFIFDPDPVKVEDLSIPTKTIERGKNE